MNDITFKARKGKSLKSIIQSLDFNKAVLYSLANKFWAIIVGIINIALITSYFSPVEQGYYYAFYNLIVFQFLLDVGFGTVLIQFVSHEWAHLKFNEAGDIEGDSVSMARLAALVRISLRWYIKVAFVFFLVIGIGGYWFIKSGKEDISFFIPWILLCGTVCLSLIIVPFRFFLEGSNQIYKSQQILLLSTVGGGVSTWLSIVFKLGLYTPFITSLVTLICTSACLVNVVRPFIKLMSNKGANDKKLWKEEFWRQQWRVAISWLCGYFMFQSFVPIVFHLLGPSESGRVGATMQIFQVVNMVGMIWVNVNIPKMGILSAKGEVLELEKLVRKILRISIAVSLASFCLVMLGVRILYWLNFKQVNGLVDIRTLFFFLITAVVLQVSNITTASVRSQKKEPFILLSMVSALLIICLNIILGKAYGVFGISLGFFGVITFILVPWVYLIYKKDIAKLKLNQDPGLNVRSVVSGDL